MEHRYDYTQSLFLFRARVAELLLVALLLAVGSDLLVDGLVMPSSKTWLGWTPSVLIAVGLLLILLSVSVVALREWRMPPKNVKFQGMFVVEKEKNRFLRVARYDLSEEMKLYISGLSENKALRTIWESGEFRPSVDSSKPLTGSSSELTAAELVREAIEYFFLKELSLHLNSHFNNRDGEVKGVFEVFKREDIPSILLKNHFLELFSKPMVEREAFSHSHNRTTGKIHSVWTSSGKLFEHFELTLPAKTTITRTSQNSILIDTKRFTMRVSSIFDGSGYAFPGWNYFFKMYLSKGVMEAIAYSVSLCVEIKMKPLSIFTLSGWDSYRWLDSFLDQLESAFSVEHFLREIGWNTACTVGQIMNSERRRSTQDQVEQEEHVIEIVKCDPDSFIGRE